MKTVLQYIEKGKAEGAKLVAGGKRAQVGNGKGCLVQPTVFDNVRNNMTVAKAEISSPVLTVIEFDEVEEAIRQASMNPYGLAATIGARDIAKAHRVVRRLEAGAV
jgi:4-guanidinobutyraldehyde dehydrogenase / NAD-dependent aldehyde dehydrogenase